MCFNFDRFMTNKTKYHGKTHFADIAYNTSLFSSDFGRFKSFINSKRLIKVPFIIYSDSKYVLVALTVNFNFGPNAKEVQDHSFCSYAYKLLCVDEWHDKSCKTYFVEDTTEKFSNDIIEESEYCCKVI